ncbi:uncharacterized protein GLRG_08557 [Colletotrichum graminicola M1.001]|uniref:Uncharacterized protein n=1 Tax=Colletotrichum graminicola (strain M1.001 / M2 / FGSC 10212) TaxID=645133 RepID=E3QRZ0_COLGM|nr:uncharacterized protein GLRG_08557 [Colletotrichum graminicola M1.001]EFQ33628.1 hypothetical protein GLRG_08557 [Colletotrichum graminicola M1.001]
MSRAASAAVTHIRQSVKPSHIMGWWNWFPSNRRLPRLCHRTHCWAAAKSCRHATLRQQHVGFGSPGGGGGSGEAKIGRHASAARFANCMAKNISNEPMLGTCWQPSLGPRRKRDIHYI